MGKSVNQAKQLFVATAYDNAAKDPGTIYAKVSANGEDMILKYVNAKGENVGSGVIPVNNIMHVTSASAESQREKLKQWEVTLNPSINKGKPKAGENYVLSVSVANYYDNSDVNKYGKTAAAHAYEDSTASDIYKQLAIGTANNFSKELDKPIKVFLGETEIKPGTKVEDIEDVTATSLIIKECEPYWYRNAFDFKRYSIVVKCGDVDFCGKLPWAKIEESETDEYIGNGKKTAELEDFCLTLSSDFQHRVCTTPLSPLTMVDPTKEYNYMQIHYCHIGSNETPQRSEKDIVIVSEDAGVLNSIIGEINTATGKSYPEIS